MNATTSTLADLKQAAHLAFLAYASAIQHADDEHAEAARVRFKEASDRLKAASAFLSIEKGRAVR